MNKLYMVGAVIVVLVVIVFSLTRKNNPTQPQPVTPNHISTTSTPQTTEQTIKSDIESSSGTSLDLSNQGLAKIPMSIFAKTDLQELNLSGNLLSGSLPAEIRLLTNLHVLNLSHNNFTGVPAEIGQLKNLEVLDLSYNNLTGLPYELGNLSHLKTLNLKGNKYSVADLAIIKKTLPATTVVDTD